MTALASNIQYSDASWRMVLNTYVNSSGLVDYQSLNQNRQSLDTYLTIIRAVGPTTDPTQFPTREHELAYYINAYNALVFDGVLSRGPGNQKRLERVDFRTRFFCSHESKTGWKENQPA